MADGAGYISCPPGSALGWRTEIDCEARGVAWAVGGPGYPLRPDGRGGLVMTAAGGMGGVCACGAIPLDEAVMTESLRRADRP